MLTRKKFILGILFLPILDKIRIHGKDILLSQVTIPSVTNQGEANEPPKDFSNIPIRLSNREVWLSTGVLLFGVLVLYLEFTLVKNLSRNVKSQDLLILFTVTLIIVGTLFLISSGVTSQDIAPALGLYGTIVGYLLGREAERQSHRHDAQRNETNKDSEE